MTEVPAVVLAGLSESQQRLLRIADNKLALNASWNLELLTAELKELRTEGVDLAVTGFDADELAELFGPMDEGVLDTEPEHPPRWAPAGLPLDRPAVWRRLHRRDEGRADDHQRRPDAG